ncbi:acetylglutamate kinase [Candidatus Levibacter sp. Uisw_134_01]|uniref:acetylglutamate kinase n=1 Tax=Candidatus Levibacter sp. Uisw_134_01 TaxID=3230999 RepID=UPI001DD608CE|nr:acetylglutamate kinase [Alphaproteobacteria bacterium]
MKNNKDQIQSEWLKKADLLTETLPFMKRYANKVIVVKFGGNAMGKKEYITSFANDIVLLQQVGMLPVVVHGGGPQIGEMLSKLKIKTEFINGLRVTDSATIDVVEMVLSGVTNKSIVTAISNSGAKSVGISGKDGNLITAKRLTKIDENSDSNLEKVIDLGYVGEPEKIDPQVIKALINEKMIPVIAPVGMGKDGLTYNINADTAAGAISAAMKASRMIMLTDVTGVLDKNGNLIPELTIDEALELIAKKVVVGGMIPKVKTCIDAVQGGAEASVIMDGRMPHSLLLELFTEHGVGTIIRKNPN